MPALQSRSTPADIRPLTTEGRALLTAFHEGQELARMLVRAGAVQIPRDPRPELTDDPDTSPG